MNYFFGIVFSFFVVQLTFAQSENDLIRTEVEKNVGALFASLDAHFPVSLQVSNSDLADYSMAKIKIEKNQTAAILSFKKMINDEKESMIISLQKITADLRLVEANTKDETVLKQANEVFEKKVQELNTRLNYSYINALTNLASLNDSLSYPVKVKSKFWHNFAKDITSTKVLLPALVVGSIVAGAAVAIPLGIIVGAGAAPVIFVTTIASADMDYFYGVKFNDGTVINFDESTRREIKSDIDQVYVETSASLFSNCKTSGCIVLTAQNYKNLNDAITDFNDDFHLYAGLDIKALNLPKDRKTNKSLNKLSKIALENLSK